MLFFAERRASVSLLHHFDLKFILTLFGPGYFGVGTDRGRIPPPPPAPLISHEVVMVSP